MGGCLTRRLGASSGVITDPFFSSVKLLCGFESSIADESPVGRTLTASGNAARSTGQAKFGTASCVFDGSGDYFTAIDSNDWDFGSGQFTVELFIRLLVKQDSQAFLGQWDVNGTLSNSSWFFYISGGNLRFRVSSGGVTIDCQVAWTPTLSTWYHVAFDRDASGKTRLYRDGSMVASQATAQNVTINGSTNSLAVGRLGAGGTTFSAFDFNGNMDEIRITKGVARYASDGGFTVPTAAYPRS